MSLTAYSPLANGRVANDDVLAEIGERYGKSPAQVALRWLVQQDGVAAIPEAASQDRLEANLDVFDFDLTAGEVGRVFDRQGGLERRLRSQLWLRCTTPVRGVRYAYHRASPVPDMSSWDERFREGHYPQDPDPEPVLKRYVETFPDGRALDIAAGTGRNAVFLAERGYEVTAIDKSREGLKIARENARKRGVARDCEFVHADALEYVYPPDTYDVITARSFRIMDRLTDVKAALTDGGVLYYQDHMRTSEPIDYGPPEERRVGANDVLRACLDLTVLHYREFRAGEAGHRGAYAQIIARNTSGATQPHPHRRVFEE